MTYTFWNRARVNRLCIAILLGTFIAVPLSYVQTQKNDTAVIRLGDFPAFYCAAVMVHEGMAKQLYDFDLQGKIQLRFLSKEAKGYILFPYPPYDAVLLAPLARFSIEQAKWILAGLMFLCLVLAVWVGTHYAPVLKKNYLATAVFFLSCGPVIVGVAGAQTAALSLLFYSGALWGLSQGTRRGEFLCGICLGLWLFKPQYAIVIIALFLFSRSWRILIGAAIIGLIYYFLGAAIAGPAWPAEWLVKIQQFRGNNMLRDGRLMISIMGFLKAWRPFLPGGPIKEWAVSFAGYSLSAVLFLWLALKFLSAGKLPRNRQKQNRLKWLLELSGPAMLLISPQPLFYDFGICLFASARHIKLENDRQITVFIILTALLSLATACRQQLPAQPIFLGVAGIFFYLLAKPHTLESDTP